MSVSILIRKLCSKFPSYLVIVCCVAGCATPEKSDPTLFASIPTDQSGITFANNLSFDKDFNIYTYRNFYNGGGVALADINNDGLLDVYLTGNVSPNKLYLNKGDFKFEDITDKSRSRRNQSMVYRCKHGRC